MSATARNPYAWAAPPLNKLCLRADWACAQGDIAGLRGVAEQLAEHATEPLHREVLQLVETCTRDPDHASVRWSELKHKLERASMH